jgi:hypothetical protein
VLFRSEAYTSGDVTVEELQRGDDPALSADALAERMREVLPSDDDY